MLAKIISRVEHFERGKKMKKKILIFFLISLFFWGVYFLSLQILCLFSLSKKNYTFVSFLFLLLVSRSPKLILVLLNYLFNFLSPMTSAWDPRTRGRERSTAKTCLQILCTFFGFFFGFLYLGNYYS